MTGFIRTHTLFSYMRGVVGGQETALVSSHQRAFKSGQLVTPPTRKAALPSPSLSSGCLLRHKLLAFYRTSLVEMPAYAESTVYSARICANIAIENTHSPLVQEHSAHFLPAVCADLLPGHKASAVGCNLVNFVGESSRGSLPLLKKMSSIPPSKSVKAMSLWWLPPFVPLT